MKQGQPWAALHGAEKAGCSECLYTHWWPKHHLPAALCSGHLTCAIHCAALALALG